MSPANWWCLGSTVQWRYALLESFFSEHKAMLWVRGAHCLHNEEEVSEGVHAYSREDTTG